MKRFITTLLLLSLVAYGHTTADWKTLDHADYSIQYPEDWEVNQSGQMGTSFFILSPLENSEDKFRENINLILEDLQGQSITLDEYSKLSVEQIKKMITKAKMIESKKIKVGNEEYQKVIYTGEQGVFKLKFEQYYRIVDGKAYVLTFTAEQDKFAKFQVTGEKILNSFVKK